MASPLRIAIDKNGRIPEGAKLKDGSVPTLVFTSKDNDDRPNLSFKKINFDDSIVLQISEQLHAMGIQSLIVEGGAKTLQAFIDQGLWDEALVFVGPSRFGKGIKAPVFTFKPESVEKMDGDLLKKFKNSYL